jgi:hypothetical protein
MAKLTEFQISAFSKIVRLLEINAVPTPIAFKDGSLGLRIIAKGFDIWIYDDEASLSISNISYVFERPDYANSAEIVSDMLNTIKRHFE